MTSLVWLGDAQRVRLTAVAMGDPGSSTPTVGRAIARVDLAIALARTGEAEQAACLGIEALTICAQRLTVPVRHRLGELLTALARCETTSVVELRRKWTWISN